MSRPGVAILTAQEKHAFIGKPFAASDVPVDGKASGHALWIGEGKPMLAVVAAKGVAKRVATGQIVDAIGTVKRAPSEKQAKREWDLSSKDAARLEHEGAYIEVSQLTVPPQ